MTAPSPDNAVDPDGLLDETELPETTVVETPPAKDWEAEYKAQQKINRDLERRSKKRMSDLEAELAAAKTPPAGQDAKPDLDAIREQVRAEVSTEALKDKALDKIEAKAARLFSNPEDARMFLASNVEDFIDAGKVDVEAISTALADLLKERPYLGVTQGDAKRFQGTGDAGAKASAGKPQLSDADVKKLYREGKFEEIETARKAGQLTKLLGTTS
jgi:hypothetical protein